MENILAYKALLQVADNNGTSLNEVITEIETAIEDTILTAKNENDQEALAMWKQIPSAGTYPTAAELITYISNQIL